jgi:hypothetical protein
MTENFIKTFYKRFSIKKWSDIADYSLISPDMLIVGWFPTEQDAKDAVDYLHEYNSERPQDYVRFLPKTA